MNPLLMKSGTELAAMIRKKQTTSLDLVEMHIEQIQRLNPKLNAMVKDRFDEAKNEARKADRKIKSSGGKGLPPFHGVPFTVKESFQVAGMPNASGLVSRKDIIAATDATVVKRMKAAGAIPLGVSNTPELCLWLETFNNLYGRTNNPYNLRRSAGGSSGGEAALISSCCSPFGVGSDFAGSIRIPAFYCGIFGHKSSSGQVPCTGHFPLADEGARYINTYGPMSRSAGDLFPLIKVLAGSDGIDNHCFRMKLKDPAKVSFKKMPVLVMENFGKKNVNRELVAAQRKCADALEKAGAKISTFSLKKLKYSFLIWGSMVLTTQETPVSKMLGGGEDINILLEMIKLLARRSPHCYTNLNLAVIDRAIKAFPALSLKLVNLGHRLRESLEGAIGNDGVLLFPSCSGPAPIHHTSLFRLFNFGYCAVFNAFEFPATQIPLGLNGRGLPLGVQAAALHGNDHLTLAVALELEKAFGGWVPPGIAR